MTIGERAVAAITERADKNGTSVHCECMKLGIHQRSVSSWKKGRCNPSAYFLQQMMNAGYDVLWILGGDGNGN